MTRRHPLSGTHRLLAAVAGLSVSMIVVGCGGGDDYDGNPPPRYHDMTIVLNVSDYDGVALGEATVWVNGVSQTGKTSWTHVALGDGYPESWRGFTANWIQGGFTVATYGPGDEATVEVIVSKPGYYSQATEFTVSDELPAEVFARDTFIMEKSPYPTTSDIKDAKRHGQEINVAYLEQIEQSVSRCRDILTLWRERSLRAESSIKRLNLGQLVTECTANAKALAAKKSAQVNLAQGPENCFIEGNNIQIFRAIQNIVTNALEAVPAREGFVGIRWRVIGRRALVEVEDNGGGFPPDKIADMQTRHYTTKGQSGGMGLGLFITKNIAEAHGGSLLLGNNVAGTGAFVTLAFPYLG